MFAALLTLTVIAASQQATPAPADPHLSGSAVYVPQRVYDTRRQAFSDFEAMLADLARADAVLVGEQHGDSNTHRLQAAMLQGLLRRRAQVTVSFEMFERDVQPAIDAYLAGTKTEEEFLKSSRPWPRYATDYRPLLEIARAHGWKVVAANVPRKYAAEVAKSGLGALDALSHEERALVARDLRCPLDDYFERFSSAMNEHPAPGSEDMSPEARRAMTERYYHSQCVKDETMAESIAAVFDAREGRPGTIVHFNGAFHSDFGAGTAGRVRRRLESRRIAIVTILPVEDLDAVAPTGEDLQRAEYLVYTVK